jgi:GNAT superfamily N-acetyltransferase
VRVVSFRQATADDDPATFAIFRRSLWDYMGRQGLLGPDDPPETPVESAWSRWERMYAHLRETAAEHWVAEREDGAVVGYARSIERAGLVELTEFFVDPAEQTRGIGRGLLERAFPLGWGRHRSIIATMDARALALYLRFGVSVEAAGSDFEKAPEPVEVETDLEVERAGPRHVEEILAVEEAVLGHPRREDISFLVHDRPAVVYRRRGAAVGYGFDCNEHGQFGPVAVLDPADLPVALAHLETTAHAAGLERISVSCALTNRTAVSWLLARGYRVNPFYVLYLADEPFAKLDRYIPCSPLVIL